VAPAAIGEEHRMHVVERHLGEGGGREGEEDRDEGV